MFNTDIKNDIFNTDIIINEYNCELLNCLKMFRHQYF